MLSKIRHYLDAKCIKSIYHGISGIELIFNQKISHFAKKITHTDDFSERKFSHSSFNKI